jgi:hypothetical protein
MSPLSVTSLVLNLTCKLMDVFISKLNIKISNDISSIVLVPIEAQISSIKVDVDYNDYSRIN